VKFLDSLRRRLLASMLLVFALGLAAAVTVRPFEGRGGLLSRLNVNFIREPYQDVLVLLLFTAIATVIIVLVSAWSLRHLDEASRQAARVGPCNPGARITTARLPTEIRPMVGAVNEALDRMAQAFEAERRFVADAAHELRTPLTVLSLRLQEARLSASPDWNQIDHDVAQMSRVVAQLLDLARKDFLEPHDPLSLEIIDLGRSVREAAALILPLADTAGRVIELDLPDRLPVRARPGDLRDVFRNLLENALVHGRGTIRVTATVTRDGAKPPEALVTVADEGTGLPVFQRERMFERFRKASPDAVGSGLGLAIVREVVRAHGGVAAFRPSAETAIQILLPAVDSYNDAQ
jgi:signal transduction histidine kinase